MGWDGAGGYTRQHNFSADASAGIKILALRMDQELDDIASAIPIALAKNGQNVPTANLPMGGFRHINVGAPVSVNNYMRSREFIENIPVFMDDTASSADRISVSAQYFTSVSANQAPGDGTRILVRALSDKSSAVLYLNGHSANVEFQDGNRAAESMVSGGIYEMLYSSVDTAWKITRPDDGRTAAERSAGVTPTNYQYEPGNVLRYGTNSVPGTTDMIAAFNSAVAVALAGSPNKVYVPAGTYLVTSQISDLAGQILFYGDGRFKSRIQFQPTANGSCIRFENGAAQATHVQLRDIGFYSTDTTYTKVAIDLLDAGSCEVRGIYISGTGGSGPSLGACWSGASSIGIRIKGRDALSLSDLVIVSDKVVTVEANPNAAANDCEDIDQTNFHNCYFVGNGNPIFSVAAGLGVQNLTFTGQQAWVGGAGGFSMNDTRAAPTVPSHNICFGAIRTEQQTDATAYAFDLRATFPIQQVSFDTTFIGSGSHGIRVNGADEIVLKNVTTAVASGKDALNATAINSRATLSLIGCYLTDPAANFTLSGYAAVFTAGGVTGAGNYCGPNHAFYVGTGQRPASGIHVAVASSTRASITYAAVMTPNCESGNAAVIVATDGSAFTINAPSGTPVQAGQLLTFTIKNTSGGALGVITWDAAYKKPSFTMPATGFGRSYTFMYDGGSSWEFMYQSAADVPN